MVPTIDRDQVAKVEPPVILVIPTEKCMYSNNTTTSIARSTYVPLKRTPRIKNGTVQTCPI